MFLFISILLMWRMTVDCLVGWTVNGIIVFTMYDLLLNIDHDFIHHISYSFKTGLGFFWVGMHSRRTQRMNRENHSIHSALKIET